MVGSYHFDLDVNALSCAIARPPNRQWWSMRLASHIVRPWLRMSLLYKDTMQYSPNPHTKAPNHSPILLRATVFPTLHIPTFNRQTLTYNLQFRLYYNAFHDYHRRPGRIICHSSRSTCNKSTRKGQRVSGTQMVRPHLQFCPKVVLTNFQLERRRHESTELWAQAYLWMHNHGHNDQISFHRNSPEPTCDCFRFLQLQSWTVRGERFRKYWRRLPLYRRLIQSRSYPELVVHRWDLRVWGVYRRTFGQDCQRGYKHHKRHRCCCLSRPFSVARSSDWRHRF